MKATPTDTRVTPVRMAIASSVREWGWTAGSAVGWAVVLVMARGAKSARITPPIPAVRQFTALNGFYIA